MSNNNFSVFVAIWDKDLGAKIIDFYPKSIELDLESITTHIFMALQSFYHYEEEAEKKVSNFIYKLPMLNINRKAMIFFDSYKKSDDKDEDQPFIVVILFPYYVSDGELEQFNEIIYDIGIEYLNIDKLLKGKSLLKKHYCRISDLFLLEEKVQDSSIKVDDSYSFTESLLDFKKGIELFSKMNYKLAYFLLKKANLKFDAENKIKLIIETSFYLGSTLSQLNKYKAAQYYFESLEEIAKELQHQKYYEISIFMGGFCAYKNEDYKKVLDKFKKLESMDIQFIDKFNFYFLYGRVLRILGLNKTAILYLQKALDISKQIEVSDDFKEKIAKVLLEMGHTNYNTIIEIVRTGNFDRNKLKSYLYKTISHYEKSIKFWEEINNYTALVRIYQIIGNIYKLVNELELSNINYRKALKYAELSNDVMSRLYIFNLIIQNLKKLKMYHVIVKEIDELLSKIISFAFIDLYTIGGFHRQLGEALLKLGQKKKALSELLISLNIYNKFDTPVQDTLKILLKIIEIYKQSKEEKFIQYYEKQYNLLKEKIEKVEIKNKETIGPLGNIKEIWLFTPEGLELFSYAPETKIDPYLFGGFLSALQNFSMELTSKQLQSITMGLDKYFFYKEEEPLFIVGRSSVKTSPNIVKKTLQSVYREFLNKYKSFLENFNGEILKFSKFIDVIENFKA